MLNGEMSNWRKLRNRIMGDALILNLDWLYQALDWLQNYSIYVNGTSQILCRKGLWKVLEVTRKQCRVGGMNE